ncbi:MAG: hypothetical protein ACREX9_19435 [Gammaproteobacteria bacterium]
MISRAGSDFQSQINLSIDRPEGLLLADPGSRYAALNIAVLWRVLGRYVEAGDWFRAALRYVDCSGADAWQGLSTQGGRRSPGASRSDACSSRPIPPCVNIT